MNRNFIPGIQFIEQNFIIIIFFFKNPPKKTFERAINNGRSEIWLIFDSQLKNQTMVTIQIDFASQLGEF